MEEKKIPYKIYLSEDELPKAWYNLRADMGSGSFYLNGKKSHYLYNHGTADAKILWVTTPPMF